VARYRKAGILSSRIKRVREPNFSSPAAQDALHELARCFARAAVDAIIVELESQQIAESASPGTPSRAQEMTTPRQALPETGFLRIRDIIGDRRRGIPGLIPVSPATWYSWIAAQRAPKPVKLGRTSVWRVEDIRAFVEQLSAGIPPRIGASGV
jgi:prophage regulatory protein